MTRCVYILDHDPEKQMRSMVALGPNFPITVFKPSLFVHLSSKKCLKTVRASYIPYIFF